jgi:hypothetical protein
MKKLIQPPTCSDHSLHRILFAGTLSLDEKIRQSAVLIWFGLRHVGILTSRNPKND